MTLGKLLKVGVAFALIIFFEPITTLAGIGLLAHTFGAQEMLA